MSQKDKISFGKNIIRKNNNHKEKKEALVYNTNNYDRLVKKLSKKYNISESEAAKVIKRIEAKEIYSSQNSSSQSKNNASLESNIKTKVQSKRNIENISRNIPEKNDGIKYKMDDSNAAVKKLSNKFNISEKEAAEVIKRIEAKEIYSSQNSSSQSKNNASLESNIKTKVQSKRNIENISSDIPQISKSEESSNVSSFANQILIEESSSEVNTLDNSPEKKDVDNIISDIIPNYNQDISIELEHVDLTFEVSNEKVDTLKELFIRSLEGKKSEKMRIHALKDVSLKVYKGEKVGLIGYNGAGKSTLLNVIAGIYSPNNGLVKTNGNISPLLSLGSGFDYNYSGRKNIYLNGAVLGYEKDYLESKMDEIIEFSELGKYIDIPIKNYSSGMLAKLGFSIATAVKPDILIIDEILAVGDVNFQKKSKDKIQSLMDGGTTVLLVSHSIPQIRSICDKAIWIDDGQVKKIGEVNKVCDLYLKDAENASNDQLANIKFR